jgi:uncharacterized protein YyaL (SSP411 family)
MLYDNAQLLGAYVLADRPAVAEGIANFLLGTLRLPSGGFASAQDSESTVGGTRVEGGYYALDLAARASESPPALDEKVLTGWNGLAIEALALAGSRMGREEWIEAARGCADFILTNHVGEDLLRATIGETVSRARPTLEDYGMFASGLIELALATGEASYAAAARELVDAAMAAGSAADAPFGVPGGTDPVLAGQGLVVAVEESDGAYPSGLASVAAAALRLFSLTAHAPYRDAAASAARSVSAAASSQPIAFGSSLSVLSALAEPLRQLVVVSNDRDAAAAGLARTWPRGIAAVVTPAQCSEFAARGFELFESRTTKAGQVTAYLCEEFVCRLPIASTGYDTAELEDALAAVVAD